MEDAESTASGTRTSPVLGGDGMCSRDRLHLPRPAFAGELT